MQRGRFYVRNCGAGRARPPDHPAAVRGLLRHAANAGAARAGPARYVHLRRGGAHPRAAGGCGSRKRPAAMQLDWQGETYVLVYNGELYNTPELRAALAARGHSFNGHSDTEVLLHAFAEWGANCVPGATVFLRLLSGSRTQVAVFSAGPLRRQAAVLHAGGGLADIWQ